jgi:hypothetical protein
VRIFLGIYNRNVRERLRVLYGANFRIDIPELVRVIPEVSVTSCSLSDSPHHSKSLNPKEEISDKKNPNEIIE